MKKRFIEAQKEVNKSVQEKTFSFVLDGDRNIDEEKQIVSMSVSSEEPYKRWWGVETLSHESNAIRLERFKNGAAFRDTHWGDQIGIVLNPTIDSSEKKLRIDVQFSKNNERAITLFKDIKDGIRKNVSIRYIIHEYILEKEVEEVPYYLVTDWEPIHASLEPDPADYKVGVGRNMESKKQNNKQNKGVEVMNNKKLEALEKRLDEADKRAEKSKSDEGRRVANIYKIANISAKSVKSDYGIIAAADKAVKEGKSAAEFQEAVFANIKEAAALQTKDAGIGMSQKEIRRFSFSRAVNAVINNDWSKAGFEREVSRAARKKQVETRGNFTIPFDVLNSRYFGNRELSVSAATAGGNLVGTQHLASEFIDVLRPNSVLAHANATILAGLVGNISIPKKTAAGTAAWVATEGGDASDTNMAFGQLNFTPKIIAARTEFTRQLMMQSNPAIDNLAEQDLIQAIGLTLDAGAITGTGSNGQPQGLIGTTGVGAVTGTDFNFKTALEFKKKVKVANAFKGNLSYITNATVESSLEGLEKSANTAKYVLEEGRMAGFSVYSTEQIPADTILFGDWSQLVIALWGGLDIIVDAISSDDGNIKIKAFQSCDIGVRYPGAFAVTSNFALA